ncbi:hypothetical protein EYC84_006804 [Monilinia fructicola]|uniref:Uncharacterized protein n=1 Tax=Monilinia fructicola TaxID=38448 RepID=A0A5M9K912_MONFR|nr:hypothetical protein EYC84_006804 [Monilinia fructicola]
MRKTSPIIPSKPFRTKLTASLIFPAPRFVSKQPDQQKILSPAEEPEEAPKRQRERKDPTRKRKRGEETIPAAVIGNRKVKRGWTTTAADINKAKRESKEIKNVVKSKYTTNEECLFKTILPPNVAAHTKATSGEKSSRRSKKGRGTVVHEFAKSTKYATFLRTSGKGPRVKTAVEFVDGKGWIDEDGNVVEEVVKRVRKNQEAQKVEKPTLEGAMNEDKISGSEQSDSSEDESTLDESDFEKRAMKKVRQAANVESSSSSDSESSADEAEYILPQSISEDTVKVGAVKAIEVPTESLSDRESSSEEEVAHVVSGQPKVSKTEAESENDDTTSSGSESSDSSDDDSEDENTSSIVASPGNPTTPTPTMPPPSSNITPEAKAARPQSSSGLKVHPLEALYKRPKADADPNSGDPKPEPNPTSFSFFGADDEDSDIGEEPNQAPLTPFTQRDIEYRGIRSAAPTPDTAHANKRFVWPGVNEDDGDERNSPTPKEAIGGKIIFKEKESEEAPESDFQKWFYEHRGENTRGWKKRRKTVAKEQRHRENKKRSRA